MTDRAAIILDKHNAQPTGRHWTILQDKQEKITQCKQMQWNDNGHWQRPDNNWEYKYSYLFLSVKIYKYSYFKLKTIVK